MTSMRSAVLAVLALSSASAAPDDKETAAGLKLKATRNIEFKTTEGTLMSVDVSPDGKTVIFDLLGDLYTVPMKGGGAKALTRGMAWDYQPRFSPDGKQIAFVSDRSGSENVWIMNVDGTQARNLTHRTDVYPMLHPSWTADGTAILVNEVPESKVQDNPTAIFEWWPRQLSRYALEGSVQKLSDASYKGGGAALPGDAGVVLVTKQGITLKASAGAKQQDTVLVPCEESQRCSSPRVSSDGRWLVYAKLSPYPKLTASVYLRSLKSGAVASLAAQDEILLPLLATGEFNNGDGSFVTGYAFTPDSKYLVLSAQGKLQKMDLGTRQATEIPFEAQVSAELAPLALFPRRVDDGDLQVKQFRALEPSPDGKTWVFTALGKIWQVGADNKPRRLTDSDLRESDPAYSPDGKWIAYVSWSDTQGGRLWKIPAAGGKPVALSNQPGLFLAPRWLADGSGLVFVYNEHLESAIKRVTEHNNDLNISSDEAEKARETQRQKDYYPARISASGGPVVRIGNKKLVSDTWAPIIPRLSISRDGQHVYFVTWVPGKDEWSGKLVLVAMETGSGKSRDLVTFSGYGYPPEVVVSPDGRWISVGMDMDLKVLPAPGPQEPIPDIAFFKMGENKALIPLTSAGIAPQWTADSGAIQWLWDTRIYQVTAEQLAARGNVRPSAIKTIELRVPRQWRKDALLLRGARLITMSLPKQTASSCPGAVDGGVIERGDILIENRRIAAVGPTGFVKFPTGARVLDVSGMTIIPGLVDLLGNVTGNRHFHLPPQHNAVYDANLAYGVTTFYTSNAPSAETSIPFEMLEAGALRGPRGVLSFIDDSGPGIFDRSDPQVAERSLQTFKQLGHPFYKTYEVAQSRYQRQLLSEIAVRQGLSTSFHQHDLYRIVQNVMDGYGMIIHPTAVSPLYRDVTELLARSGTVYNAAPFSFKALTENINAARHRKFWSEGELSAALSFAAERKSTAEITPDEKQKLQDISRLMCGGTIVGTGTDAYILSGLDVHSNLWSMAGQGGLSSMQALQAATLDGIRALGMEADLGSIEPGKIADLAILEKNPLENIRHTATTRYVVKDGFLYDADTLEVVKH